MWNERSARDAQRWIMISSKFQVPGSKLKTDRFFETIVLVFNLEPGTWNLELK